MALHIPGGRGGGEQGLEQGVVGVGREEGGEAEGGGEAQAGERVEGLLVQREGEVADLVVVCVGVRNSERKEVDYEYDDARAPGTAPRRARIRT